MDEDRHFALAVREIEIASDAAHLFLKSQARFSKSFGHLDFWFCSRASDFGHAFATLALGKEVHDRDGMASYNSLIVT